MSLDTPQSPPVTHPKGTRPTLTMYTSAVYDESIRAKMPDDQPHYQVLILCEKSRKACVACFGLRRMLPSPPTPVLTPEFV